MVPRPTANGVAAPTAITLTATTPAPHATGRAGDVLAARRATTSSDPDQRAARRRRAVQRSRARVPYSDDVS